MSDFLNTMFPEEESSEKKEEIVLGANDIYEITKRFSGLSADGSPKATISYCAYEFNSPDDDVDRNNIRSIDNARIELSLDKSTGFYTMDLIFDNSDNTDLKLLWSSLQHHKSNETFFGDKMWIFYMNLMEKDSAYEENVFTANVLNPVMFFLTRQIPNQEVEEEEYEKGMFVGGNVIRFLLHKDLVSFQYMNVNESEEKTENAD